MDYRKRRTEHSPILIDGAIVEQVESFKFLGVHITNQLFTLLLLSVYYLCIVTLITCTYYLN